MIFVERLFFENCEEQQKEVNFGFIDLAKAFDIINQEILWKLLIKFGSNHLTTSTTLNTICKCQDRMLVRVSHSVEHLHNNPVLNWESNHTGLRSRPCFVQYLPNSYNSPLPGPRRPGRWHGNPLTIWWQGFHTHHQLKAKTLASTLQVFWATICSFRCCHCSQNSPSPVILKCHARDLSLITSWHQRKKKTEIIEPTFN